MSLELTKISALPSASAMSDTDLVAVVQAGVTKKATGTQIKSYLAATEGVANVVILNISGTGTLALDAGAFVSAMILTGSTGAVKVGTSVGGGEIIDDSITTGTALVYPGAGVFAVGSQTLYFTGTFKIRLMIWNIGE